MDKKKIIIVISLLVALWFVFDVSHLLTLENAKQQQALMNSYIADHFILAIVIYFSLYIIATALSVPGAAIFTLLGAALFGFWWSLFLVSFASTIGATLAFLFSRYLLRDWVQKKFSGSLKAINQGITKEGYLYLLTLRLIPVFPFFIINLLMGLTAMRARSFYLYSQIGMLPATAVYLNAGTQLADIETLSGLLSPQVLTSLVILGLFPMISKLLINKIKLRKTYAKWTKPSSFDRNMVVIGAGSGGLVTAYIAAAVKAKVTLIEKHKMGGDCLNTGCVPSKALIRTSHNIKEILDAQKFGIDAQINTIDFKKVMGRIQDVITKIEPHDSVERYSELGVECLQGEAKIITPWHVELNGEIITTQNIVIATGAKPFLPPIPGLTESSYVSSDTIWSLTELPKKLLVLGGGPIGCELAQCFNHLGSEVTLVERLPQILIREDADAAKLVHQQLTSEGVEILLEHNVSAFTRDETQQLVELQFQDETILKEFDIVLVAIGRAANVSGFGLEELDIELTDKKTIAVNDYLQTKYPNIYAVGDVTGPFQLTHAAAHQAWYAAVNGLFGRFKKFATDYSVMPAATYTYPELARVGINEKEAQVLAIDYEITQYQIDDLDRAIADSQDLGFVKVLTAKDSDKILGVTIVAAHAGDLLAEFTLAMRYKLGLNKILSTIHPYPTMSEAAKYTAGIWKKNHAPQTLLRWVEKYHNWTRK
ncbi:dihydrolipoyl dehydrogenase [Psychromonas antarctica]|uniref:dihydrolipoyl dehydrogenase n=1 Tax=Psychromonas antarctica TaxID=67573 RepID=UPI001EE8FA26|nr:dihydrolipoyl dehydrogenase [Psychromonas antarctica]MCG6201859.1 dihydrolipoyl dehydrogenase [Psychromonas antarctica]